MSRIRDKGRDNFNPKRKMRLVPGGDDRVRLDAMAGQARYEGNPEHKKNRDHDFHTTPLVYPRPDKTLCDLAGIFKKSIALALLKKGIRFGLVSERVAVNAVDWPQNVWAVTEEGIPLEAQHSSGNAGTYHGYPMPENDPFREVVLKRWKDELENEDKLQG